MNLKQEALLGALMHTASITAAAAEAKISKTTALRYCRDPEFRQLLKQRREEQVDSALHAIQSKYTRAAEVLIDIIEDDQAPPAVRVNAINSLYSNGRAFSDSKEIAAANERLEHLEQLLGNS